MGNILSVYTAAQRSVMLDELSTSIREHGFAAVLDVTNLIIQLKSHLRVQPVATTGLAARAILSSEQAQPPPSPEELDFVFNAIKNQILALNELTGTLKFEFPPSAIPRIECPTVREIIGPTGYHVGVKRIREVAFDDVSDSLEETVPMKRMIIEKVGFPLGFNPREFQTRDRAGNSAKRNCESTFEGSPAGYLEEAPARRMALGLSSLLGSDEAPNGHGLGRNAPFRSPKTDTSNVPPITKDSAAGCPPHAATPNRHKGVEDLTWDTIGAVLQFLPRKEWGGLALTNRRFRADITGMVLREERVASFNSSDPQTWELKFSTLSSFAILNNHWRLGPLFQPVKRITFSLPYDVDERNYCSQIILEFFQSLSRNLQHAKVIYINLGIIWDMTHQAPNIDYVLWSRVFREIHRSGCGRLNISSVDILGPVNRGSLTHILSGMRDEQMHLNSLSVESVAFSSPPLTPWFMRQLAGNPCLSYLKLTGTGFTAAQLDVVLCYVDVPQLESLVIGDAWLATVIELLQRCPRLNSVHLLELSTDLRVADGVYASLPGLHSLRGNATALSRLIPSLINVPWEFLWEIEVDTNQFEDPDDYVVHTLDAESCLKVIELLLLKNAKLENLAFTFPSLPAFTTPLFQMGENEESLARSCEVNRIRIKLHCETEQENGRVMDAMVPWISHFHFAKSILLYSVGPRISALDKFAFRSGLYSFRPDLAVKVE